MKSEAGRDLGFGGYRRSREGAWIEIKASERYGAETAVAPARERGLKSQTSGTTDVSPQSLPRGSVD